MLWKKIALMVLTTCLLSNGWSQDAEWIAQKVSQIDREDAMKASRFVDSLHKAKPLPITDTILSRALLKLSTSLSENYHYTEGTKWARMAMQGFRPYAETNKSYLESRVQLGNCLTYMGRFDSVQALLSETIRMFDSLWADKLIKLRITSLAHLGIVSAQKSEFKKAIYYFSTADSLNQVYRDKQWQLTLTGYMGNVFLLMENFEDALANFEKNRLIAIETGDHYEHLVTGNNMGMCYIGKKEFDQALRILAEVRPFALKLQDSMGLRINYENTADALLEKGKYDEASIWLDSANKVLTQEQTTFNSISIINKRALIHLKQEYFEKLLISGTKLKSFALQLGETQYILSAYDKLRQAYEGLGDFENAYYFSQRYSTLNDSIKAENFDAETAEMQARYKSAEQAREIEKLNAEGLLSRQQIKIKVANNRLLWVAMTAVFILLLVMVYFFLRIRNTKQALTDKNQLLVKNDKEKAILLKELHHRVKNNLQIVSSLLNMQGESVKDQKALEAFKEGQHRVDAMAMIHKHLYGSDELSSVDISAYLERLVNSLAHSYGFNRQNFELRCQITQKPIDVDVAIPLGLMVNELASNAFKHAFNKNEMARMYLVLRFKDDQIILSLTDNGMGLPDGFSIEESDSFGLELVQTLVKQLKGEIRFYNDDGATFQLRLKPSKAHAA